MQHRVDELMRDDHIIVYRGGENIYEGRSCYAPDDIRVFCDMCDFYTLDGIEEADYLFIGK